jgi:hypothetical protein
LVCRTPARQVRARAESGSFFPVKGEKSFGYQIET